MMKSSDGGSAGRPENRLTARSNEPHQALTGVRASAIGRAERGEDERRAGRGGEVGGDLGGVVVRVLVVLVERDGPRDLLRGRVDRDGAGQGGDHIQNIARDLADRPVGGERDAPGGPSLCSTSASWERRSSATTSAPEPSGAGSGAVSQPRAVRRSAACWSWGSGGASATASLPRT